MTVEGRADYRIIENGIVKFSEIEVGIPITLTALDSLTKKYADFTILPIGKYEGSLPTVAFRIIDGKDFSFSLFGQSKQPFQLPEDAEFIATSSGHLVHKLDLNHYDKGKIQVGNFLDLGFEYLSEDQLNRFAARSIIRVKYEDRVEGFNPPDLTNFFQEIETANRK